jgi:hypothetical protein
MRKGYFLDNLKLQAVPGGYKLLQNFRYVTQVGAPDFVHTVPEGFITDLASIPRIFRPLITGHGKDRWAAVVHDYLYSIKYSRKDADDVFYEALIASGNGRMKSWAMYRAVRAGGWVFYR